MPKKVHVLWRKIKSLKSEEYRQYRIQFSLRWHVLDYVQHWYKTDEEIRNFFSDFLSHGCVSGWIDHLTFYVDTHRFYDKYYDDIEELREEWELNVGEPLKIKGDLKNFLAWFGFEETAYQIANELDIEI